MFARPGFAQGVGTLRILEPYGVLEGEIEGEPIGKVVSGECERCGLAGLFVVGHKNAVVCEEGCEAGVSEND